MLPSYPPIPWHVTGFDAMLYYAGLEDGDHGRAAKVVHALRRESLRRGAKLSAAKTLHRMYDLGPRARLRAARQLAEEAPSPRVYYLLVSAEVRAGNEIEARVAAHRMLGKATEVGDLDHVETARELVERPSALCESRPVCPDTFSDKVRRASGPKADGYTALQAIQQEVLRVGGRATAVECARALLHMASRRSDVPSGVRFARDLIALEASSFSYLALAIVLEPRAGFARALRFACVEGDIHRATKSTAGLLRTNGEDLVTRAELRWAMAEAKRESAELPDYNFLLANLGMPGAA